MAGTSEVWLIHTSDRPPDMTIWNRGSRDVNKTISVLCQPHTSEEGCASTITRDIKPASEGSHSLTSQDANLQLDLALVK